MSSIGATLLRPIVKLMGRQICAARDPEQVRAVFARWSRLFLLPPGVRAQAVELGNVPAIRVIPNAPASRRALLVLHGGGYVFGTAHGHQPLAAQLAKGARASAYVADYRLAPEHPYPAAVDDASAAYRALLDEHSPQNVAFVGDSAGGGLAVATMQRARDAGLPLPGCAVLFCPWLDLTGSGASMTANAASEILIPPPLPARMAAWYAGGTDLADAGVSPLFGRCQGLPPLLLQASSTEVLLSDSERFAERARGAGVEVTLQIETGMWHDWQLLSPIVGEARRSMAAAVAFLDSHLES